jgi:hypothetical protein
MKSSTLEGVFHWSRFQPDRAIDFNGFFFQSRKGGVLIDPLETNQAELEFLRQRGGARWILLTNFDHLRGSLGLKEVLSAEILAPAEERERFGPHSEAVDRWYGSTADLPGELRESVEVFALRGGKSPVEMACFLKQPKALLFGDLVRSHASGRLMLLPDAKLKDREAAVQSLRPLAALGAAAVLLGDGDSFFYRGGEAFAEFLHQLGGEAGR